MRLIILLIVDKRMLHCAYFVIDNPDFEESSPLEIKEDTNGNDI